MNIRVRVYTASAQKELATLRGQVAMLEKQLAAKRGRSAFIGGLGTMQRGLMKTGNQLQWTGRQLQYNWTLPLLLAAGAATKWQLENEKAFTRVEKVYGDAQAAAKFFNKEAGKTADAQYGVAKANRVFDAELNQLAETFELLSSKYGVAQKEVIEVAGAWAAAGQSGLDLAKVTELTQKAMILGDLSASESTQALIAIQAQYSLSTKELALTLAELNAVENQTGASMGDLIVSFSRAAGVAREAGVDVRQLAAMTAALVPATGTASQAGNALKTMISRLMSPTGEAADIMKEMGFQIGSVEWNSANAVERLALMSREFGKLSGGGKQVASSVIASRWQINKFNVLMREMGPAMTYYEKALDATNSKQKSFNQMNRELQAVLDSNPKRLEIIWNTLKNAMTDVVQPMIPYIVALADQVKNMVTGFSNLDPSLQKFILTAAFGLAVLGPLVRYFGSFLTLIGVIAAPLAAGAAAFMGFFKSIIFGTIAADGATKKGVISMALTWLAFPFKMLLSLWSGFVFRVILFWAYLPAVAARTVRQVSVAFAAMGAIGPVLMGTFTKMYAAIVATWRAAWAALIVIQRNAQIALMMLTTMWSTLTVSTMTKLRGLMTIIHVTMWTSIKTIWAAGWTTLTILTGGGIKKLLMLAGRGMLMLLGILTGPWGLLAAAVGLALALFWDEIKSFVVGAYNYFTRETSAFRDAVMGAWMSFPEGVRNALSAVARTVKQAAMEIYGWFSYINPFARHSPSLVENVTNGMAAVRKQFGTLGEVESHIKSAYSAISRFGKATASLTGGSGLTLEQENERKEIAKVSPAVAAGYVELAGILRTLNDDLDRQGQLVAAQEAVTAQWESRLDSANAALDRQNEIMSRLEATLTHYQDQLSAAESELSRYASMPIQGMRAMEDKIFDNEIAQKRLRLEMLKMGEAGDTIQDVQSKLSALAGAQELLAGERAGLQQAGAGSDVTAFYDQQIKALEGQRKELARQGAPVNKMQADLDRLQKRAEIMDLTKALKFDPLTRQIEQASTSMEEMPFDQIMSGTQRSNTQINAYQQQVDAATRAVNRQQRAVNAATAARDRISARYDAERAQLEVLEDRYGKIEEAVRDVEAAMRDAAGAARTLNQARADRKRARDNISPGLANFRRAQKGDFADKGGSGIPIRTDFSSQADEIAKFNEDLAKEVGLGFSDLNPFQWFKDKWDQFMGWWGDRKEQFGRAGRELFQNIEIENGGFKSIRRRFGSMFDKIKGGWDTVKEKLESFGGVLLPDIRKIKREFEAIGDKVREKLGPQLDKFKEIFDDETTQRFIKSLKIVAGVIGGALLLAITIVSRVFADVLGVAIDFVIDMIDYFIRIIRGFIKIFVGIFTLDVGLVMDGFTDIISGAFWGIVGIFAAAGKAIWKVVGGIFQGIWDFAFWLYDELIGHSIIPDIVNGIFWWFEKLWDLVKLVWKYVIRPVAKAFGWILEKITNVVKAVVKTVFRVLKGLWDLAGWVKDHILKPVWKAFGWVWDKIVDGLKLWWRGITRIWNGLKKLGGWFKDNVLRPVWDAAGWVWDKIQEGFKTWWRGITRIWSGLKDLGGWFKRNVMDKVFGAVKDGWERVKEWLVDNKDMLLRPAKAIGNGMIGVVNWLIKGLNKVAKVLPGLNWEIDLIPKFASGGEVPGRRVGGGFKTNGARAIVGEGKANHPEYVIPTDPTYRGRARSLLSQAAAKLGVLDPPMFARGGELPSGGMLDEIKKRIGSAKKLGKDGIDWIKGTAKNIASAPFRFFKNKAQDKIDDIEWKFAKALAQTGFNKITGWVGRADKAYEDKASKLTLPKVGGGKPSIYGWINPMGGPYRVGGSIGSYPGHTGLDLPAMSGTAIRAAHAGRVYASYDIPGSNQYNNTPYASYGRVVKIDHGDYTTLYAHMRNRIAREGQRVMAGSKIGTVGTTGNSSGNHLHYEMRRRGQLLEPLRTMRSLGVPMSRGGIVAHRPGGMLARVGEGSTDEAVVPLPRNWKSDGDLGGRTVNIYGNLEFPNIEDGSDVEEFLNNLEILAKD